MAAGDPSPAPTDHHNLLSFSLSEDRGFPTIDEMSCWLFHEVYRRLQQQALAGELRRVAYQLFGSPAPEAEASTIERHFQSLLSAERDAAGGTQTAPEARRTHRQVVSWTVDFHRSLMREYAAADLLVRMPARAARIHALLRWPFYAPINEHPEWAAWAVVIELAIRRRCAGWAGCPERWLGPAPWALPAPGNRPAVRFSKRPLEAEAPGRTPQAAPRIALTIEVGELRQMINCREGNSPINLLPRVVWQLRKHAIPWWQAEDARHQRKSDRSFLTPDAKAIWRWAIGSEDGWEAQRPDAAIPDAHGYFRGTRANRTRDDAA